MSDDADQPNEPDQNEYNYAPEAEGGPEDAEGDADEGLIETPAKALGLTEAPSARTQQLLELHPELWPDYEDTVLDKAVIRDAYPPLPGSGKDKNHTTSPFLTLYEKAKIISLRASQLAHGSPPFIEVPDILTDVYLIAKAELEAKRLPYLVKRPLPDGTYEYWRRADLMLI
jgi:DNA-directed RNA polymerase I, II, and III subunit RPABC2